MTALYDVQPTAHLPDWIDIMVYPRSAIRRILDTRSLPTVVVRIMLRIGR